MTYEYWCQHSKALVAESEKYDGWRQRAKLRLLTDIAPRIGKLSEAFYMGCGFHYALEQQLGKVIAELAMPVKWSANWCGKIPEDRLRLITLQVSVAFLISKVVEAEQSMKGKIEEKN